MAGYKKLRTPLIKPRSQGGTFYTFSSALEDIGLNINESKNRIALSHYVLLDIPAFTPDVDYGDDLNAGDYDFARRLQNYALNMETVIRNDESYNFAESLTVSERVFWKFMKHEGFMNFVQKEDGRYYTDANEVVKGFGPITAGAQRTDSYGIYNETYVQIPSSYGQMEVLFKPVIDKNYHITSTSDDYFYISDLATGYIENVDESEFDPSTGVLYTGIPADSLTDDDGAYIIEDEDDSLCVELALDKLNEYYESEIPMSYDDMGIGCIGMPNTRITAPSSYKFNAILVYYSIYDSTGVNILATNAYGILLINSAELQGESEYKFPSLEKRQTTPTMAGSSYAFRLNIKTSSVYSGNVIVNDESTASYEMTTEFNDVVRNLAKAVDILKSNAEVIALISSDNNKIKRLSSEALDKIDDLEKDIATIRKGDFRSMSIDSLSSKNVSVDMISPNSNGAIDIVIGNEFTSNEKGGGILSINLSSDGAYINNIQGDKADIANVTAETLITSSIQPEDREISFNGIADDVVQEYGKVTPNGIYSSSDFHFKNSDNIIGDEEVDGADADKLFNAMQVFIDSSLGYHLSVDNSLSDPMLVKMVNSIYSPDESPVIKVENPDEAEPEEGEEGEETETGEESEIVLSKSGFYNMTNLIMLLMAQVKGLSKRVSELETAGA